MAASKFYEAVDMHQTQQMQNEFNNILLSEDDGPTKYKAIRALPQKWGNPINAVQGGSQLIGMEMNQSFNPAYQNAQQYRQMQVQSLAQQMIQRKQAMENQTARTDAYVQRQSSLSDPYAGMSPEEKAQAVKIKAGLEPRATAAVENRTDTIRYFDKDKKMQSVQVPHAEYNAAVQRIQAEGGNLDTRQGKVDKFSDDYLKGMGFSDQEIPRIRRIGFGLESRATATGSTNEKELSNWLTQRKKTIDTWGEPINTPEMSRARDLADKKIDEILTRIEQEPTAQSQGSPQQPSSQSFSIPNHDPLAYEAAPGSIVVPAAPQPTQAAPVAAPDQTAPTETQSQPDPAKQQAMQDARVNLVRKLKREPTKDEWLKEMLRIYGRRVQ